MHENLKSSRTTTPSWTLTVSSLASIQASATDCSSLAETEAVLTLPNPLRRESTECCPLTAGFAVGLSNFFWGGIYRRYQYYWK